MQLAGVDVNEGQTRIGGGIAITRALGDHFAKDNDSGMIAVPYISEPIKLTPDDTHLVLASDGVRTRPVTPRGQHSCGGSHRKSHIAPRGVLPSRSCPFQLWDVMAGRRALNLARTRSAAEGAQHLLKAALHSKECKDNVTVTVVRL